MEKISHLPNGQWSLSKSEPYSPMSFGEFVRLAGGTQNIAKHLHFAIHAGSDKTRHFRKFIFGAMEDANHQYYKENKESMHPADSDNIMSILTGLARHHRKKFYDKHAPGSIDDSGNIADESTFFNTPNLSRQQNSPKHFQEIVDDLNSIHAKSIAGEAAIANQKAKKQIQGIFQANPMKNRR